MAKIKPIKATPAVSGKYAKSVISEAMSKPSEKAITRNINASRLLKKVRG